MNSRERVLAAVEHRTPDRTPLDFGATRQSGIMASAYHAIKKHLGIKGGKTYVYDLYQMLAEIEQPVRERMHSDVVALRMRRVAFGLPVEGERDWALCDGTPVTVPRSFQPEVEADGSYLIRSPEGKPLARMPRDGWYFDSLDTGPGAAHVNPDRWSVPELPEDELRHLERQAALWRGSDYAVIGELPQVELFFGFGNGGFDDWMVTLMTEPEYVRELNAKAIEGMCRNFDLYWQATSGAFDIAKFNDDFGMQQGEIAAPDLYRELILPYYAQYIAHIKKTAPRLRIMQHCCGSIFNLLGDMIEAGVEIINPVQTSAANMDPWRLKDTYGNRVCFWGGGVENQGVLRWGTAEECAAQAAERVRIFGAGGGFVFNTIHNIQAGTPPENIVAAFDTAWEGSV